MVSVARRRPPNHDPSTPTRRATPTHPARTPSQLSASDSTPSKAAHIELVRASENKADLLLAWGGVAYGVLVTLILTCPARFPGNGRYGVVLALIMLSLAVMLILITVRPRIP